MSWLTNARAAAQARFEELGLPTTRMENWKYTSTRQVAALNFVPGLPADVTAELQGIPCVSERETRLVFVNGAFDAAQSRVEGTEGLTVRTLADALVAEPERIGALVSTFADAAADRGFDALNTMHVTDGAVIEISGEIETPVHVIHVVSGERAAGYGRVLVLASPHASASVVESHIALEGDQPTLSNAVTELHLQAGSRIAHHVVRHGSSKAFHVGHIRARVQRDARLDSGTWWLGGAWARNDLHVELLEPGAHCELLGLYLTSENQHVDNHTCIDHAAPHCTSRELYKGVLGGKSTAVFNGRVLVQRDAQKTDADQSNHNLLLSDSATVNTKPELEIYADDVKCAHGTTVGQLDDDHIWYLRSRGIPLQQALQMLTRAFVADVLEDVSDEGVRALLGAAITARFDAVLETT